MKKIVLSLLSTLSFSAPLFSAAYDYTDVAYSYVKASKPRTPATKESSKKRFLAAASAIRARTTTPKFTAVCTNYAEVKSAGKDYHDACMKALTTKRETDFSTAFSAYQALQHSSAKAAYNRACHAVFIAEFKLETLKSANVKKNIPSLLSAHNDLNAALIQANEAAYAYYNLNAFFMAKTLYPHLFLTL